MHSTGDKDDPGSCQGKKPYRNWEKTRQVIRLFHRRVDHKDGHMMAYWCKHCQAFHIGGGAEGNRRKR